MQASNPVNHFLYPALTILVEFYTIYLKNLSVLKDSEPSYTNQLVALKGTLYLCLYEYGTTVTNGITNTIQIYKPPILIQITLYFGLLHRDHQIPSPLIKTSLGGYRLTFPLLSLRVRRPRMKILSTPQTVHRP